MIDWGEIAKGMAAWAFVWAFCSAVAAPKSVGESRFWNRALASFLVMGPIFLAFPIALLTIVALWSAGWLPTAWMLKVAEGQIDTPLHWLFLGCFVLWIATGYLLLQGLKRGFPSIARLLSLADDVRRTNDHKHQAVR